MLTVNLACDRCNGAPLCVLCRKTLGAIDAAGYRSEHSSRYEALRAAAAGRYAFEACLIRARLEETHIIDAVSTLLHDKRVAVIAGDDGEARHDMSPGIVIVPQARTEDARFIAAWLSAPADAEVSGAESEADERRHATRRMRTLLQRSTGKGKGFIVALPSTSAVDTQTPDLLEDEIAWAEATDGRFAVIVLRRNGDERVHEGLQRVRNALRSNDSWVEHKGDLVAVLPDCDASSLAGIEQRLSAALLQSDDDAALDLAAWRSGAATWPTDGATADALLSRADTSMKPLRRDAKPVGRQRRMKPAARDSRGEDQ